MENPENEIKGRAIGGNARAEKLSSERKTEIAKVAAAARWSNPRTPKPIKSKELRLLPTADPRTPQQTVMDLQVEKQIEIDGVGMGVLSDGTPYLTGRGLARLCGIDSSRISEMSADWNKTPAIPIATKIQDLLKSRGVALDKPYIEIKQRSGSFYAYPDVICLAVLVYYAFDAPNVREEAKKNYRLLAGKALHDFIYAQVGYDPNNYVPAVWQQFHDRVSLTYNSVPKGYFSVFKEIADMIVTLGQAGLHIDSSFVPDGSVGTHWSKHWDAS
jgi:hypothetical protein